MHVTAGSEMVVFQDFKRFLIVSLSHIRNHFFQIVICSGDSHPVSDRILANADQFGKIIFIDPVDSVIVKKY